MKKAVIFILIFTQLSAFAQKQFTSSEIYQEIKKLDVLGNVLYLAAHPDDENTRFIAYCANEKLYNTSYLSLTRGDGGQNLIGPEIREELGVIRTQELLAARRLDGGQQYFSRANDFGYSKTPDETLEIWDKEKILSDVVWIIRKLKPDVIVCRFPTDGGGGHGHHTASALLGVEAFEKAADKTQFPEQLKYVEPWQVKRIVVNTGRWWNPDISADDEGVVAEDIGVYNALKGISYNELAAHSRTMHKSQGFGSLTSRGEHLEYFEHLKGEQAKESLFDGIPSDWDRVKGAEEVKAITANIIKEFDVKNPENSIPDLIMLRKELDKLSDTFWKNKKKAEVAQLIKHCAGLYMEATANNYWATNGDSVNVNFELIARNKTNFKLKSIKTAAYKYTQSFTDELIENKKIELKHQFILPETLASSQSYWLKEKGTLGTYSVKDQLTIGKPENDPVINYKVMLDINGTELKYDVPLIYKWRDPVKGELNRPFVIVPPAFVNFVEETELFSNLNAREIELVIKSTTANLDAELIIEAPKGWKLSQKTFALNLLKAGEEQKIKLTLQPTANAQLGSLTALLTINGKSYTQALKTIEYDHIPTQVYMPEAKAQLVYIDIKKKGNKVGFFAGAGDKIPEALRNVGYEVDELTEADITPQNLMQYDAVVLGIRAVNVNHRIGFIMPKLLQYCKEGGTLILQYNTAHRLKTNEFGPYPLKLSRDRVTEESAEVTFLQPSHPVLNSPNKITKKDFDGWVQERGLYFPNEWDKQYNAILSWHDKGDTSKEGSLLVAPYGKGYYVYTGISFFRELPAGVPGAYRLFVNLISLGNE